jgi:hypothetical protein
MKTRRCVDTLERIRLNDWTASVIEMVQNCFERHVSMRRRWLAAMCCASFTVTHAAAQSFDQSAVKPNRLPAVASTRVSNTVPVPAATASVRSRSTMPPTRSGATVSNSSPRATYLKSSTARAAAENAVNLIERATIEYESKAWLSAEKTAWDAILQAAISVDLANQERFGTTAQTHPTCEMRLERARTAMTEARDFSGVYGPTDDIAIRRIARGHQTGAVAWDQPGQLGPNEASDRYLDYARTELAAIAGQSVEAARAMDLLAAIHLGRNDEKLMPSAAALCLRRAALQGQPGNASLASRLGMHLADVGLDHEARWAMEHSLAIEFDPVTAHRLIAVHQRVGDVASAHQWIAAVNQANQHPAASQPMPNIVELSPSEFASVSKPVMTPSQTGYAPSQNYVHQPTTRPPSAPAMSPTPSVASQPEPSIFSPSYLSGRLASFRFGKPADAHQAAAHQAARASHATGANQSITGEIVSAFDPPSTYRDPTPGNRAYGPPAGPVATPPVYSQPVYAQPNYSNPPYATPAYSNPNPPTYPPSSAGGYSWQSGQPQPETPGRVRRFLDAFRPQ